MKIQIENNNVCVTVDTNYENYDKKQILDICDKAYDTLTLAYERDIPFTERNDIDIALVNNTAKVPIPRDEMVIRPRIPNNVVDINELTIEKAVTENALVRCPNCGQAHCLAVPSNSHIYLMRRNFNDNEFGIIAEFNSLTSQDFVNVCCKPETDRKAYYEDLQSMSFEYNEDFAVNNETELFCPVCCKSNIFSSWKDAFENPLRYFETEHLCDACGGEKLEKLIKEKKVYECDKCGLQIDFKEG